MQFGADPDAIATTGRALQTAASSVGPCADDIRMASAAGAATPAGPAMATMGDVWFVDLVELAEEARSLADATVTVSHIYGQALLDATSRISR